MRVEHFLIISTIILLVLASVRLYKDSVSAPVQPNPAYITVNTPKNQPYALIELSNITINIPEEGDINEFELTGVSISVSDSIYYFDAFNFTPQVGVTASTDKFFYFNEPFNSESIMAITGIYKGVATYFPFCLNDVLLPDHISQETQQKYALSVILNDITKGSCNHLTPCNPDAIDVKIKSI